MASTNPSATDRLSRQRTYRRLMVGSIVVAVLLGLGLRALGQPLLGEAVYWLGILAFFGIWFGSPMTLFDERDLAIERRASHLTLLLAGAVLVVGASSVRVLSTLGVYEVPPVASGVLYGYVGLFATFAVVYLWLRYRP